MNIQNILVNLSGAGLGLVGSSTTVSLCLLCGVSGTMVIPIQVSDTGYMITVSGA